MCNDARTAAKIEKRIDEINQALKNGFKAAVDPEMARLDLRNFDDVRAGGHSTIAVSDFDSKIGVYSPIDEMMSILKTAGDVGEKWSSFL